MARQAPHRWFPNGFVYFIVCDELRVVKIGFNNRWIRPKDRMEDQVFANKRRISELQTGCPAQLRVAAMVGVDTWGTEKEFQNYFKHFHKHGEWYWYIDALADFVAQLERYSDAVADIVRRSQAGEKGLRTPEPPFLDIKLVCPPPKDRPKGWAIT